MKYRIYIDEVGNSDLGSSDNPNHRFLSLTGIIVDLDYVNAVLHPEMEELKRRFFGSHADDPIIFHRKEMLNSKGPFACLKEDRARIAFDEQLLSYLRSWDYTVISVCLDKLAHKEKYTTWRYDPYHYCLKMILERYALWLKRNTSIGDAMAEARGGKDDLRLKTSFERLYEQGTEYLGAEQFQSVFTSKQLKIKAKSNNIAGLQLADLVAYPSRNEILDEQKYLGRELAPFTKLVIEILQHKYDRMGEKVYGKKFI